MKIESDTEYQAALERLGQLGDNLLEEPEPDEFFAINAAMLEYETRNHPALERGGRGDRG